MTVMAHIVLQGALTHCFPAVCACCLVTAITTGTPAAAKPPEREPSLPLPHFLTLVGLSAWVVAADTLQENHVCGSWQYWLTQLSVLVPVAAILLVFRQILLK